MFNKHYTEKTFCVTIIIIKRNTNFTELLYPTTNQENIATLLSNSQLPLQASIIK